VLEKFRTNIHGLSRAWKRVILVVFDFAVLLTVLWVTYSLRLPINPIGACQSTQLQTI